MIELLYISVVLLVGLAIAAGLERLLDKSVPTTPRTDQRIPARERELLGDDWRDCAGLGRHRAATASQTESDRSQIRGENDAR